MILCWTEWKRKVREMLRTPSCMKLSSIAVVIVAVIAILGNSIGASTTTLKPSTTSEPFIGSPLFVGLAAGIGGFVAFVVLCCLLWKCCCSDKGEE